MTTFTITFDWPDNLLSIACVANGYTWSKSILQDVEGNQVYVETPQTEREFMKNLLMEIPIFAIVQNSVQYLERKHGTDNYNASEKLQEVLNLITIS